MVSAPALVQFKRTLGSGALDRDNPAGGTTRAVFLRNEEIGESPQKIPRAELEECLRGSFLGGGVAVATHKVTPSFQMAISR
jgi:hypothetical protein